MEDCGELGEHLVEDSVGLFLQYICHFAVRFAERQSRAFARSLAFPFFQKQCTNH